MIFALLFSAASTSVPNKSLKSQSFQLLLKGIAYLICRHCQHIMDLHTLRGSCLCASVRFQVKTPHEKVGQVSSSNSLLYASRIAQQAFFF
jgi:hypothetical protein